MQFLTKLWRCYIKKDHSFGKAQDGADMSRFKVCRHCGHEQHVKRRARKA